MPVIYLPYHLDGHLPDLNLPVPSDSTEFTAKLPDEDVWTRMAALYDAVAEVTQQTFEADGEVTVVSGDCTLALRPPDPRQILLVDARDLDPAEFDYIASAGVQRKSTAELSAEDLPAGPLLVNLDLDVVDPEALPGARFPAANGPDTDAVLRAARTILGTGRVVAFNVACTWDPSEDVTGVREQLISALLEIRAQT